MLPPNTTEAQYAEKFTKSYPFHPDVIDVLYEHWGTFNLVSKNTLYVETFSYGGTQCKGFRQTVHHTCRL